MMIRSTPAFSVIVETGQVPHAPTSSTWTTPSSSIVLEDDVAAVGLQGGPDRVDRLEHAGFHVVARGRVSGHDDLRTGERRSYPTSSLRPASASTLARSRGHEVLNQPPPLVDFDVVGRDPVLLAGIEREGAAWAREDLGVLGRLAGSAEAQTWARHANESPPVLRTHDRYGFRIDEVEYHPDYHRLMDVAVTHGLHGAPWSDPRPGAHVARARPGSSRGRRTRPVTGVRSR